MELPNFLNRLKDHLGLTLSKLSCIDSMQNQSIRSNQLLASKDRCELLNLNQLIREYKTRHCMWKKQKYRHLENRQKSIIFLLWYSLPIHWWKPLIAKCKLHSPIIDSLLQWLDSSLVSWTKSWSKVSLKLIFCPLISTLNAGSVVANCFCTVLYQILWVENANQSVFSFSVFPNFIIFLSSLIASFQLSLIFLLFYFPQLPSWQLS